MYKRILFLIWTALLFLTACGGSEQKSELERLKAENDSLIAHKLHLEEEVNGYFASLFEVQEGIAKIKAAHNVIPVRPLGENTPEDVRNRVKHDISFINDMIETNRKELEKMRDRMGKSNFRIEHLEKTLDQLQTQLNEESAKVVHLERQLQRRDSIITEMGITVDELGRNIDDLTERNIESEELLQEQDDALNAGWYAIGNQRELKDNKIISSDGIFSSKKILQTDFNKNYFVKVDTREVRSIPLYTRSKAKVMTTHPRSSYKVEKEDDGYILHISDPKSFWSVSKYLVVEID